ncbi:MAG: hypothetical protein ACREN6_10415 [Gemmatimonadaceae bacterium]
MTDRDSAILEIRHMLQNRASPRLHMATLVSVTAAAGFATSFLLLRFGLTRMVLRYPLAVSVAYLVFLGLVNLWLRRFRLRERARGARHVDRSIFDFVEVPIDAMWRGGGPTPFEFGGGGGFDGAGASGAWGDPAVAGQIASSVVPQSSAAGGTPTSAGGGKAGWSFDFDSDGWLLIVAAVVAALAFGVVIYVVYIAPALFAELLLDAGLAAGLYRRLAKGERRTWLATAVRKTAIPAAAVASLLALSGLIVQSVYPDAVSVGRVVDHIRTAHSKQSNKR